MVRNKWAFRPGLFRHELGFLISRHRTILVLLVIFSASFLQAQQLTVHDLAQRVDRHYNQLHSLKAQFVENYEGMGRMRTESGTLLLLKPGRMRWDYTKPAGKLFLLDGKYAWFYSNGDRQVQRIGAKQLDDLRSPLRFLLGHTKLEKEIDHLALTAAANGTFTLAGIPHGPGKTHPASRPHRNLRRRDHRHRNPGDRRRGNPFHLHR